MFSPRTVGVRGLVLDDEGRVMLVRHSYGPDAWHFPGGGVKRRERLDEAVRRELREEVGVDPNGAELWHVFTNLDEGKSDHIVMFVVREWRPVAAASREIGAKGFFRLDDLPATTSAGTRRRLEEWAARSAPGFAW